MRIYKDQIKLKNKLIEKIDLIGYSYIQIENKHIKMF